MPLYEYHCLDCDEVFAVQLSISDHETKSHPPCPGCGGSNVRQHFSGVSVITSKKS
jgi:putative FmdB family regulatory protein